MKANGSDVFLKDYRGRVALELPHPRLKYVNMIFEKHLVKLQDRFFANRRPSLMSQGPDPRKKISA